MPGKQGFVDRTGEVMAKAKEGVRNIYIEAAEELDDQLSIATI